VLIDDLRKSIAQLQKNPPAQSVSRTSAGGYNHS